MSKSAGVSGYLAIGDAFYSKHVQLKVVHNPGRTAAPNRERYVSCVADIISPSTGMTRKHSAELGRQTEHRFEEDHFTRKSSTRGY